MFAGYPDPFVGHIVPYWQYSNNRFLIVLSHQTCFYTNTEWFVSKEKKYGDI